MTRHDAEPAEAPEWLLSIVPTNPVKHERPRLVESIAKTEETTKYGEAALDNEVAAVASAPWGQQEDTLNTAALKIGGLIAGGEIKYHDAQQALVTAGQNMANQPGELPWTRDDIEAKVRHGLDDGMKTPRAAQKQLGGQSSTSNGKKLSDADVELSQCDKVIEVGSKAKLWHDADDTPYATVFRNGHYENYAIRSKGFHRWLRFEYGKQFTAKTRNGTTRPTAPSSQAFNDGLLTLEAMACQGPMYESCVRVGGNDNCVYIDLGKPDWSAIKIDQTGWELITNPPVKFIRPSGLRPLPTPRADGNIDELRSFINVTSDDDFTLIIGWFVGAFAPKGPYPILVVNGEQGSAKSMLCRVLRRLIDPNLAEMRSAPKDERDLVIAAKNGHVIALDNLSHIPASLADAMCRISTGSGFATRTLYTDADETIIEVCRPQIVNGIPDLAIRPDLTDRSIVLTLPTLDTDMRRTEEAIWSDFKTQAPGILGAIFNAVATALANRRSVKLATTPRMADFARWVEAAAPELGLEPGAFLGAYERNRASANETTVEADAVARFIQKFISKEREWSGSATDLLEALNYEYADAVLKLKGWPGGPGALSNRLRRASPALPTKVSAFILESK
jgi:putative DNA primase/helicase